MLVGEPARGVAGGGLLVGEPARGVAGGNTLIGGVIGLATRTLPLGGLLVGDAGRGIAPERSTDDGWLDGDAGRGIAPERSTAGGGVFGLSSAITGSCEVGDFGRDGGGGGGELGGGNVAGFAVRPDCGAGTGVASFASTIASSSALRAAEPGGGGGTVRCFLRGDGDGSVAAGGAGAAGGSSDFGTLQPSERSAIRALVASPSRRRVRSSSGTGEGYHVGEVGLRVTALPISLTHPCQVG